MSTATLQTLLPQAAWQLRLRPRALLELFPLLEPHETDAALQEAFRIVQDHARNETDAARRRQWAAVRARFEGAIAARIKKEGGES